MAEASGWTYYNEIDPYCVQWLRNLIKAGHLPDGEVDDRPIQRVWHEDLKGFTQCHFFAGIGGWPLALRMAGWPEDQEVWTGSCPCQPFSIAGRRRGEEDERHLWPEFRRIISGGKPSVCFGEQVASADGRLWLDRVSTDLEALGYEIGAADLCAASIGASIIRQRLWFVAESGKPRLAGSLCQGGSLCCQPPPPPAQCCHPSLSEGLYNIPHPNDLPPINGIPRPVGEVQAYGNAIVPQIAAEFISAYLEAREILHG